MFRYINNTNCIIAKELRAYFTSPIAYVFIVIFLVLSGLFNFYLGKFFLRGQADLLPFFSFHPWLYNIFVPAISMRLWADEKKSGTIELLFTLPLSITQIVIAKFVAAWLFISFSLSLTFPMWVMVNYLGEPDHGIILISYLGSMLLAGGFLSIGTLISALTKNQVTAFILTLFCCLILNLAGFPLVIDILRVFLPTAILDLISGFSFLTNFENIVKGLLDLKCIIFFATLIIFCLYANQIVLELSKHE